MQTTLFSDSNLVLVLSSLDCITYKKLEKILRLAQSPKSIFYDFDKYKSKIQDIVETENISKIEYVLSDDFIKSYNANLARSNISFLTQFDEGYPQKLLEIDCPPFILFYRGNVELLKSKHSLAVVGSRQPTSYGKWATEMFAKSLSENEFTIVSGLAYGVDAIAHSSVLGVAGKTIAVLPGGLNEIYPAGNVGLADEIVKKNGLLITEYKPNFHANTYTFPVRNRIIAGLADGVLITEAGEKSGALHTKEYALNAGRDLFVVPGNINSKLSYGTNRLIKSCQGALVTEIEDILSYYNISPKTKAEIKKNQLDINGQLITKALSDGEKTFEELIEILGLDTKKLNSCLTTLQISGIIRKLPGNIFCLN